MTEWFRNKHQLRRSVIKARESSIADDGLCDAIWLAISREVTGTHSHAMVASWALIQYGCAAAFCYLYSAYESQVNCNGHAGYYENGYLSGQIGCFNDHTSTEAHDLMLKLWRDLGLDTGRRGNAAKVYGVAARVRFEEDDGYDAVADEYYDSDGGMVVHAADELDDDFYRHSDAFMRYLNERIEVELGMKVTA